MAKSCVYCRMSEIFTKAPILKVKVSLYITMKYTPQEAGRSSAAPLRRWCERSNRKEGTLGRDVDSKCHIKELEITC
jgi:hypothetical protein